ncbi:MAG: GTP pyrophosphokinase [Tissierellales bacterium]|nr:GTP pyrophosphokinase [Tissierellales bacterium]
MDVERAIELSYKMYYGRMDDDGVPFISHPIEIALKMKTNDAKIAALFHDALEEGKLSIDDLVKNGFSEKTIEICKYLYKKEDETYLEYIRKVKNNEDARRIKIEDIKYNIRKGEQILGHERYKLFKKAFEELITD